MLKNWCFQFVVLEKTLESPLDSKIKPVNPKVNKPWIFIEKDWCWSWSSNTLATWCEELTHWKRPRLWERFKAKGEEGDREWDDWVALPVQWIWTSLNSGRWWGTGRPTVMQSMGFQRVRHNLVTEQKQQQDERGPCRQLKSPSCPTKTQLPKIVPKRGRNSTRQSRLFPSGTYKRNTKKNLWEGKKNCRKHRKRRRKKEGGRERERKSTREREFIPSQKNCKGNTRPHLSTCAFKGCGERRW